MKITLVLSSRQIGRERAIEFFVGIAYLGMLQPFQVVCTPRSRRCKIFDYVYLKSVCANDIPRVYRVM